MARHGGYWETWLDRPYEVARVLGVPLSDTALERLVNRGVVPASLIPWFPVLVAGVFIAVGIGYGTWRYSAEHTADKVVVDNSGREKM